MERDGEGELEKNNNNKGGQQHDDGPTVTVQRCDKRLRTDVTQKTGPRTAKRAARHPTT